MIISKKLLKEMLESTLAERDEYIRRANMAEGAAQTLNRLIKLKDEPEPKESPQGTNSVGPS